MMTKLAYIQELIVLNSSRDMSLNGRGQERRYSKANQVTVVALEFHKCQPVFKVLNILTIFQRRFCAAEKALY